MFSFPAYALECIRKIEEFGYDAYLVGGCVRDAILGRPISDIDITTNARPENIIEIFEKTIPTGIKHGTVTVIVEGNQIEVTTFRTESGYADLRHPDNVEFVSNLQDDLARRDFTINAMAFSPRTGLIDLFGGRDDLAKNIIRTVCEAKQRFSEDALRILRAFRFASVLDFEIENETQKAAIECSNGLCHVSGERILQELIKLAKGKRPSKIIPLYECGALKPFGLERVEISPSVLDLLYELKTPDNYTPAIFLSLLVFDVETVIEKLKLSNVLKQQLLFLAAHPDIFINNKTELKMYLSSFTEDYIRLYIEKLKLFSCYKAEFVSALFDEVIQSEEPYKICHLKLSGNDIIKMGYSGKDLGIVLNKLLKDVIIHPEHNNIDTLKKLI